MELRTERGSSQQYGYVLDELGSPVRLLNAEGGVEETYGYDEFGQRLEAEAYTGSAMARGNGRPNSIQGYGYTGYQMDEVSDTYFAQAREYVPGLGRFAGEDIIKGSVVAPFTQNSYGYCFNQPMDWVDLDGREPGMNDVPVYTGNNGLGVESGPEYPGYWDNVLVDGATDNGWKEIALHGVSIALLGPYGPSIVDNYKYIEHINSKPQPPLPTDKTNLPDYTSEMQVFIDGRVGEYEAYVTDHSAREVALKFYHDVKTGGPMDIKNQESWKDAFGDLPHGTPFIFRGEVVDVAIMGNYTYAYLGTAISNMGNNEGWVNNLNSLQLKMIFSEFGLKAGGGLAEGLNGKYFPYWCPNLGEAPEDIESILKGVEWYNEECPTE